MKLKFTNPIKEDDTFGVVCTIVTLAAVLVTLMILTKGYFIILCLIFIVIRAIAAFVKISKN